MKRLYLAPFAAHNATELVLRSAIDSGAAPHELCYITPSPRKLRDTQLRFARLLGRRAFVPPLFATPGTLSHDVYRRFGSARLFPSELRPLLVRSLLAGSHPQPTIGYCSALADFIRDVKLHFGSDLTALEAQIRTDLTGYDTPLARALEAVDVLRRYSELLHARGWVDDIDVMLSAATHVDAGIGPFRVLILDGFVAPNLPEQTLLAALISRTETVFAIGYGDGTDSADYSLATRFCSFIAGQGGFETVRLSATPRPEPSLIACRSEEDEILTICRHIRRNLAADISDTVLAFPRLNDYAPLVRRIFPQFGLQFTIYPDTRLSTSPPVVAVLELLQAVSYSFPRLSTAAALSSPFLARLLQLDDADCEFPRYAAAVNHYSKRAGIIKGSSNWQHLRQRLAAAEGRELDEPEATFVAGLEKRIGAGLRLASRALGRATTLGAGALALKELLGRIAFGAHTPNRQNAIELDLDQQQLYNLLDALIAFEHDFGTTTANLSELHRVIARLAAESPTNTDSDPCGVLVLPMSETLGLSPKHMLLGGLAETALPGRGASDPILPDRVRTALGMPDMSWHRDWQRFHLRRNLECAVETTFLSFPDSRDGAPLLPTPYLETKPTPAPAGVAILSAREAQVAEGRLRRVGLPETEQPVDFNSDSEVSEAIARHFGPDCEIQVTALEAYRRCPFLFYLEHVLGLSAPEEPRFDVDARQWGMIAHRVFEKLYADGAVSLELIPARVEQALGSILADTELHPFWQQVTRRVLANLLPDFIQNERQLREEKYLPLRTESRIGGVVADGLRVKGRLDRLDAGPCGLRILDYKTGRASAVTAKSVIEDRTHVQLPLYARLVQAQGPVDNVGIYSLRKPGVIWLAGRRPLTELVDAAISNALEIVAGIRAGRFPPATTRDACRNCELGHTCGMQPETAALREQQEVEP